MKKIKKPNPPEHIVLVDTNILWFEDKVKVVNPDFELFWEKYGSAFPMKLIIPEVVRGEILYQQTESALKLLKKANSDIEAISKITAKSYSHRVTEERIKKEVEERFDSWTTGKSAEIKATPVADIDWQGIINSSIWRSLPFTPDAKNPKNEKGFRDSMILETVCAVCKYFSDDVNIAFVCNDYALRTASDSRLGDIESFSTYESLKDFQSFIELTQKDLNERFVKSIISRAASKFFESGNEDSLLFKDGFYSLLRKDFDADLNNPKDPSPFGFLGSLEKSWIHVGKEQAWVGKPIFKSLEGEKEYHWESTITIVRLFEKQGAGNALLPTLITEPTRRLLVFPICVHWKAEVRADGRFFVCKVVDYEKRDVTFEPPTIDQLERYGIQRAAEQDEDGNG